MPYQIKLPDGHDSLQKLDIYFKNLSEASPPQNPAIVILNPSIIMNLLTKVGGGFESNQFRYPNLKEALDRVSFFELPIIQLTHSNKISFVNGRHRTFYMASKKIEAVPYLTMNGMVQGLKSLAGTTNATHFDLQNMIYPVI